MESRLPPKVIGTGWSAKFYNEFIADFDEKLYEKKRSDLLGKHFLNKMANMKITHKVKDKAQAKKSISGTVFELLVAEMLIMHNITPFYMQVEMWKVPMSKFDFLLYHETKPIILTCKLSLAERWRQASVEGVLLKNIYRQGKCFLIAGDVPAIKPENARDVQKRNEDIDNSKIDGIDRFYTVGSEELFKFFKQLSKEQFSAPEKIDPIVKFSRKIDSSKNLLG